MSVKTFDDLYVEELRDLYSAERQLVTALPKVAKAAYAPELKEAVEGHLEQTKQHVARLESIFEKLGEKPTGHKCKAMEGLIEETKEMIEEIEEGPVRDAALIGGAQKVEHYEISGYGTARAFAEILGHPDHIEILQSTIEEEGETDHALTELSMKLNRAAAGADSSNGKSNSSKSTSKGTETAKASTSKSTATAKSAMDSKTAETTKSKSATKK